MVFRPTTAPKEETAGPLRVAMGVYWSTLPLWWAGTVLPAYMWSLGVTPAWGERYQRRKQKCKRVLEGICYLYILSLLREIILLFRPHCCRPHPHPGFKRPHEPDSCQSGTLNGPPRIRYFLSVVVSVRRCKPGAPRNHHLERACVRRKSTQRKAGLSERNQVLVTTSEPLDPALPEAHLCPWILQSHKGTCTFNFKKNNSNNSV